MFSRRIITVLTTAAAIGLAAVGLAGPAAARTVQTGDEMFLAQMRSLGVSFPSPQEAVREGHQVCAELSAGKTPTAVTVAVFRQTNLTPRRRPAWSPPRHRPTARNSPASPPSRSRAGPSDSQRILPPGVTISPVTSLPPDPRTAGRPR